MPDSTLHNPIHHAGMTTEFREKKPTSLVGFFMPIKKPQLRGLVDVITSG